MNPNEAISFGNRALAKQAKGDHRGAIADHDQAISMSPTDDLIYSRGLAEKSNENYGEAIADFSRWIANNPDGVDGFD